MQNPAEAGFDATSAVLDQYRRTLRLLALHFLGVTLDCGSSLALALGSRLLVELTRTDFGQNAGFSQERLKRRSATSKGSFSLTLTAGIQDLPSLDYRWQRASAMTRKHAGFKGCGCYPLQWRNAKP